MKKLYIKVTCEYLYEIEVSKETLDNYESPKEYFEENKGDITEDIIENQLDYVEEKITEIKYFGHENN